MLWRRRWRRRWIARITWYNSLQWNIATISCFKYKTEIIRQWFIQHGDHIAATGTKKKLNTRTKGHNEIQLYFHASTKLTFFCRLVNMLKAFTAQLLKDDNHLFTILTTVIQPNITPIITYLRTLLPAPKFGRKAHIQHQIPLYFLAAQLSRQCHISTFLYNHLLQTNCSNIAVTMTVLTSNEKL